MLRNPGRNAVRGALLAVVVSWSAGCAATDEMIEARQVYSAGDYVRANQLVEELVADGGSDAHVYQLEQGMTELALGDPDAAISCWRAARDKFDELAGEGFGETVAAWMSDDTELDYEGSTYERVLVRALLAAAELVAPDRMFGDDAVAYANQILDEHIRITEQLREGRDDLGGKSLVAPSAAFKYVAFGSYVVAIVREADPINRDEARFQMRKVVELEPDRTWLQQELQRLERGPVTQPGKGVVHVLGLVGRGPYRVEQQVEASQAALALAGIIVAIANESLPQISLKGVPIDVLTFHPDNPDALLVSVDGQEYGQTNTVTDVEQVAQAEYDATYDYRVARALIRRAFKFAIVEGVRAGVRAARQDESGNLNAEDQLIDIGIMLLGAVWQAAEVADLRCWSLLPATCQALRLELDPGVHEVVVQAEKGGYPSGAQISIQVQVDPRRPTYVLAVVPTAAGGPPLLSRQLDVGAGDPAEPSNPRFEKPRL
ncbi:MAG: hypothetical protein IPM29_27635 [Planctomycetes bacterium]|nr:hypothetical protein [Planctomycetota bacterium]